MNDTIGNSLKHIEQTLGNDSLFKVRNYLNDFDGRQDMSFFLYRFIDAEESIIYIGRTNDIRRRILKEHFSDNAHLPDECYLEIGRIEYTEIINESEEVAYEAILINQSRPKYNTQFKDEGQFEVQIPEFCWSEFEWEYEGQLTWLKKKKKGVISAHDVILNNMSRERVQGSLTGIKDLALRLLSIGSRVPMKYFSIMLRQII